MENFKWKNNTTFLRKKSQVAIINGEKFVKVNKEYFDIIDYIIKNNLDLTNMQKYFVEYKDCTMVSSIIDSLKQIEVLLNLDEEQENSGESKKLKNISLVITNKCNLSCIHCSQNAYQINSNIKELNFKEICKVVDIIGRYDIESITITGGEPLTRSDFIDIVKYIREKYKGTLILLTNGILISENNVENIINLFDYVSISIDGIDEELTSKIRGKGVFEKVLKTIKLLQRHGYYNIELSAILPSCYEIEKQFDALCEKLLTKAVNRSLLYSGRAYTNFSYIDKVYHDYVKKHGYSFYDNIEKLCIGSLETCEACKENLTINSVGDVYPCNLLQEPEFKIGNLLDAPYLLKEYQNSAVSKQIEKMINMEVEHCENCEIRNLCWFCLADYEAFKSIDSLQADYEAFKSIDSLQADYCNKRKKSIYNYYFEG